MIIDKTTLGMFMYERDTSPDFEIDFLAGLWQEAEGIREFWEDEAQAILEWIDANGGL